MQTFLPFDDFKASLACLDNKRLGKQRVETFQILNILLSKSTTGGWRNHPAVLMWRGYENALMDYYNLSLGEWLRREFQNNMKFHVIIGDIVMPKWFGLKEFHDSHKSNLYRKDPIHYKRFESIGPNLEYFWPTKKGYYETVNG